MREGKRVNRGRKKDSVNEGERNEQRGSRIASEEKRMRQMKKKDSVRDGKRVSRGRKKDNVRKGEREIERGSVREGERKGGRRRL